jgi:hypothetical protein
MKYSRFELYLNKMTNSLTSPISTSFHRAMPPATVRFAEEKDRDYEAEIAKMEKEALERLDAKSAELMAKITTTGATSK